MLWGGVDRTEVSPGGVSESQTVSVPDVRGSSLLLWLAAE